jgi:hypothetical protein
MKKIMFVFFILAIFFAPLIFSDTINSLSSTLESNVEKAQVVKDTVEKSQDTQYWEEKWDYLGNEWKAIFMKNSVVASLDSFFTKTSIVFEVLFGVPYSMSLVLLGIVLLWVFFLINISRIINASGLLSLGVSYLGGALILIIFAQLKVLESIVILLGRLAFSPEYVWTRLIILFVIFASFGVLSYFDRKLSAYLRLKRKAAKEREAEISRQATTNFADSFLKNTK